jgi:hypothetical protein
LFLLSASTRWWLQTDFYGIQGLPRAVSEATVTVVCIVTCNGHRQAMDIMTRALTLAKQMKSVYRLFGSPTSCRNRKSGSYCFFHLTQLFAVLTNTNGWKAPLATLNFTCKSSLSLFQLQLESTQKSRSEKICWHSRQLKFCQGLYVIVVMHNVLIATHICWETTDSINKQQSYKGHGQNWI